MEQGSLLSSTDVVTRHAHMLSTPDVCAVHFRQDSVHSCPKLLVCGQMLSTTVGIRASTGNGLISPFFFFPINI